jgi:hypothetical protein
MLDTEKLQEIPIYFLHRFTNCVYFARFVIFFPDFMCV